jgi:hypothetical protein
MRSFSLVASSRHWVNCWRATFESKKFFWGWQDWGKEMLDSGSKPAAASAVKFEMLVASG